MTPPPDPHLRPDQPIRPGATPAQLRDLLAWKRRIPVWLGLCLSCVWITAFLAGYGRHLSRQDVKDNFGQPRPAALPVDPPCNGAVLIEAQLTTLPRIEQVPNVTDRYSWRDPAYIAADGPLARSLATWQPVFDVLPEALACDYVQPDSNWRGTFWIQNIVFRLRIRAQLRAANGDWAGLRQDTDLLYRLHELNQLNDDRLSYGPNSNWHSSFTLTLSMVIEHHAHEIPVGLLQHWRGQLDAAQPHRRGIDRTLAREVLDVRYQVVRGVRGTLDIAPIALDPVPLYYPFIRRDYAHLESAVQPLYEERAQAGYQGDGWDASLRRGRYSFYPGLQVWKAEILAPEIAKRVDSFWRAEDAEYRRCLFLIAAAQYLQAEGRLPTAITELATIPAALRIDPYGSTGENLQCALTQDGVWCIRQQTSTAIDSRGRYYHSFDWRRFDRPSYAILPAEWPPLPVGDPP